MFRRLSDALRDHGILYVSFKYGDYDGERKGRQFTDLREDTFKELMAAFPELIIREKYISKDVRPGRETEEWLNAILEKNS